MHYPFGDVAPPPGELVAVAPGIDWWSIPVPGPLKQVNGYILADDGPAGPGVTLVDTGLNTDAGVAAWRALLAEPLAGRAIRRVVCTHHHPDHAGLAGWLARKGRAPIAMSRIEWLTLRLLAADARPETPPEVLAHWHAAGWDAGEVERGAAHGWDRFGKLTSRLPYGATMLADGDTLAIGGHDWTVVIGRGHSPDHVCLLDERRGLLIAGDQVLPRISSNVSVGAGDPNGDPLGDWLASIARFRLLPADLLVLPGHGAPFRGLHDRLDALATEHRERLDALVLHLAAAPRRARDCFPVLFRRPIGEDMLSLATGEALAHLHRLEREGRAARDGVDGVWWWRAT